MNVISKTAITLTMALAFTTSHASCVNADGSIEGGAYVGAVDMLPACEKASKQTAVNDDASPQKADIKKSVLVAGSVAGAQKAGLQ